MQLEEFIDGQIWTAEYSVQLPFFPIKARMSIIRLDDGKLILHSPGPIDDTTAKAIAKLGSVAYIVAPGLLHHLHLTDAQRRFPQAKTFICPGIDQRIPKLSFDWILGPCPPAIWSSAIDQELIRGNRFVTEVAMFHKESKTLLLVDSIENYTDQTLDVSWRLKVLFKFVLGAWNKARPAPEYRLGWKDVQVAQSSLQRILDWDFEKIILSHGDNIVRNAKAIARSAWTPPLDSL